jgi:hypothetical protein
MFSHSPEDVIAALMNMQFATDAGALLKLKTNPVKGKTIPNHKNLLSEESHLNNQNTTPLSTTKMDTNWAKSGCTSFLPMTPCYWPAPHSIPTPLLPLSDLHIGPLPISTLFTLTTATTTYAGTL